MFSNNQSGLEPSSYIGRSCCGAHIFCACLYVCTSTSALGREGQLSFIAGPLDVLKIRLQSQVIKPGEIPKYHGTVSGLQIIWKEEGIRGLFRGLGATTIAYIADRAIWFATYNHLKEMMAKAAGELMPELFFVNVLDYS